MPRVVFSSENKAPTTNYDYPKLKLKVGERARVLILEDPIMEYVHTLRKPQIINGTPQVKEVVNEKTGQKTIENVMDFMSRPICLGDATILSEKGSDPKNCPMCKLALEHPDMTRPPQRRYAMHVIRYRTKGGSTDLVTPYSVETLVWAFTDQVFNKIVDAKEEWGDLRKHDLLLGPCQAPEHFQKFDISVASKAAWLESAERKQLTAVTFKENQIPDLTIAAGSAKKREWVDQDVRDILEAWAEVSGAAPDVSDADLDTDLSSLLDSKKDDAKSGDFERDAEGWAKTEADDDPLAGLDDATPEPEASKPSEETPQKEKPSEGSAADDNFDDLLADL